MEKKESEINLANISHNNCNVSVFAKELLDFRFTTHQIVDFPGMPILIRVSP